MERIGFPLNGGFYDGDLNTSPNTEFNKLGNALNKLMVKHPNWQPITNSSLPNSHYADGIERAHMNTWEYKKPTTLPVFQGPTHPIQKMSRINPQQMGI